MRDMSRGYTNQTAKHQIGSIGWIRFKPEKIGGIVHFVFGTHCKEFKLDVILYT